MNPVIENWMNLAFRWLHVVAGVMWIGHLYFFNFVNSQFAPTIDAETKKKVAAIVTEYRKWSHADVIVGKVLEGFNYDNGVGPNLRLVSMFVDQFPEGDMSRALAKKYKFMIYDTIAGALTLGGETLAVDGVLNIGEHGNYPSNAKGQKLYPRYELMEQIVKAYRQTGKALPLFVDKLPP
jgi:hypothetical protein